MNTQTYDRLLWQIPVLILMVAMLLPEISWYSSMIGAWPIWLLSMPVAVMVRLRLRQRKTNSNGLAVKYSHILVFNHKRVLHQSTKQAYRQAA